tara:strand:+ start:362 stop:508 length:147 start_codon:yes stop_codon:yes gene_type:complete
MASHGKAEHFMLALPKRVLSPAAGVQGILNLLNPLKPASVALVMLHAT